MNEIYKIVLERNRNRQVLNKSDIKRICDIIISKCRYKYKVFIVFDKLPEKELGDIFAYTIDNCIIFYMDSMKQVQEKLYALCDKKLDGCKTDYFNHFIVEAIFHEFQHIKQYDMIVKRKNNIETKLFLTCSKIKKDDDFYFENYGFFPVEKNAYCESGVLAYNIYNRMPKGIVSDNDKRYYAGLAMSNFIKNYSVDAEKEIVASPTEILLYNSISHDLSMCGLDEMQMFDLISQKNEFSLYKKLSLGLPITYEEYAYANLLYDCIQERQNVDFVKKLQLK